MKPISTKSVFYSLATVVLAVASGSSLADTTWNLGGCANSTNLGSVVTCANPNVVLSGYSNQINTTTTSTSTINGRNFVAANLYDWGSTAGLGVVAAAEDSGATGPHALDNTYGIDALMIKFTGGPMNLTGLTIGWNGSDSPVSSTTYNDSDLSVFVWKGASAPTATNMTSLTPGSLQTTTGWSLVGNYADVGTGANLQSPLGSSLYSSYWLISAYSTAYGAVNSSGAGTLGQGTDAFKLLSIAGNACTGVVTNGTCGNGGSQVPEPGSLALMGVAMAGFVATRRRKQQAV